MEDTNFISTEIDLDRDVPTNGLIEDDSFEDDSFDFDAYCDEHPDFNEAINGDYVDYTGFDSFLEKNLVA